MDRLTCSSVLFNGSELSTTLSNKQSLINDTTEIKLQKLICSELTLNNYDLESAINNKQETLNDGDLSISKTSGLQVALNEKQELITMHTSLSMNQVQVDSLVCKMWNDPGSTSDYFKEGEIICNSLRLLGLDVDSDIVCNTILLDGTDLGEHSVENNNY